jgi:general stress protein YciG
MDEQQKTNKRGFAAMDKAVVSAIASRGGKRAHELGTAHCFNSETARLAGSKGGRASAAKRAEKVDA